MLKWVDTLVILFPEDGDRTGPRNSVLLSCPYPCTDGIILHKNPTNELTPLYLHGNTPICSLRMAPWWPKYVGVFLCQQSGFNVCKFITDFYIKSVLSIWILKRMTVKVVTLNYSKKTLPCFTFCVYESGKTSLPNLRCRPYCFNCVLYS